MHVSSGATQMPCAPHMLRQWHLRSHHTVAQPVLHSGRVWVSSHCLRIRNTFTVSLLWTFFASGSTFRLVFFSPPIFRSFVANEVATGVPIVQVKYNLFFCSAFEEEKKETNEKSEIRTVLLCTYTLKKKRWTKDLTFEKQQYQRIIINNKKKYLQKKRKRSTKLY